MPLRILPHGRLQEWVAEEQGYFAAEGLEYTFLPEGDYGVPVGQVSTGAFETFGAGRGGAGISCACHWATNAAAGRRAGRLVTTAYSVTPCAVMVPPESPVRGPADLARVPVGVPAATLFGVPLYIAEAFGFRKVLDATFMIGFLVTGPDVTQADVGKYLAALRHAQMDIDLHAESFKHHHLRAVPAKYRHRSTCAPSAPVSASSSSPTPGRSSRRASSTG